eukprot:5128874-Alexandrium_andersonii.AAC.1
MPDANDAGSVLCWSAFPVVNHTLATGNCLLRTLVRSSSPRASCVRSPLLEQTQRRPPAHGISCPAAANPSLP